MNKKRIIVIEGADGCGKTTQINALKREFGDRFKFAKLPWYESATGKEISRYLDGEYPEIQDTTDIKNIMAVSGLYTSNRVEFFNSQFDSTTDYIFDRYTTANILHMGALLGNTTAIDTYIKYLESLEYDIYDIPKPDLVIYLDIPKELSIKNIESRNTTHDVHEGMDYINKLYNVKDYIIQKCGWVPIQCGNTDGMFDKDTITKVIKAVIESHMIKWESEEL